MKVKYNDTGCYVYDVKIVDFQYLCGEKVPGDTWLLIGYENQLLWVKKEECRPI